LADIKKVIQEILREELARLGIMPQLSFSVPDNHVESNIKTETDIQEDIQEDDLMDIDMLESAMDLLAVEGKVNDITAQVLLDPCANISFIHTDLIPDLKLEIDTNKTHKLSGASGGMGWNRSLGTVRSAKIELAPGCIIEEDLAVVKYKHKEIGLSRACLKRYNYDIHESREHVALTCNGKNFFIPIVPDKNRT
jgi:hypothetical protein